MKHIPKFFEDTYCLNFTGLNIYFQVLGSITTSGVINVNGLMLYKLQKFFITWQMCLLRTITKELKFAYN